MKLIVATIQMPSEPMNLAVNRERADVLLREAHQNGASLAALPEMFNTGYGLIPDYAPVAETADGPTLRHLRERARQWKMVIAAGFVEREGHHLYDSLALVAPDGSSHVYRKRNLVFWERFRFHPGHQPSIVDTPFGKVGLAICADMIYRRVWEGYRDRIDLAIVSAAWPEFACRLSGRKNWLLGHLGPLSGEIPGKVAADLGVPVVFSNQCGPTRTTVPLLGIRVHSENHRPIRGSQQHQRRSARAGLSGRSDRAGRGGGSHRPLAERAEVMPFYVPVGSRGPLLRFGMMLTRIMGALTYRRALARRIRLATVAAVEGLARA